MDHGTRAQRKGVLAEMLGSVDGATGVARGIRMLARFGIFTRSIGVVGHIGQVN
jgi:hypothetical protein